MEVETLTGLLQGCPGLVGVPDGQQRDHLRVQERPEVGGSQRQQETVHPKIAVPQDEPEEGHPDWSGREQE